MNRAEFVRRRQYSNVDAMRSTTPESHIKLREEMNAQIDEFLAKGGKITQLPINVRAVDYTNGETQKERSRRLYKGETV